MSAFGNLSGLGAASTDDGSYNNFMADVEYSFNSGMRKKDCDAAFVGVIDAYTHFGQHLEVYGRRSSNTEKMRKELKRIRREFEGACVRR